MRTGARRPTDDELRTRFEYALAAARDQGVDLTDHPLDTDTADALSAVAEAYPNPPAELIDAAERAFQGLLDGTNGARRAASARARLLGD
ncbi:hypothetical protein [Nocardia ignorata]|uniref:Uncharacterized protein n=1 Tax=Nocardia ignorata TaxID=145285 RepID=A0A4R6NYK3_NOCIG|nr:hypothetical protein [Nocardia ignorata]TDP29769.1 hypothetical protein DFR75_11233 [Nocardia ignorata]